MRRLAVVAGISLLLAFGPVAEACTLWAANGSAVKGGGSVIVKNRDWEPDHRQELRLVIPGRGYRYVAIYATGGEHGGIKAGVNEKGLVVVTASAGSIPENARQGMAYSKELKTRLLRECGGVDEALTRIELFFGPQILMLADGRKVATVEIGPDGAFSVKVRENGVVYHTNHYIDAGMQPYNRRIGHSSARRFQRIAELLEGTSAPYAPETLIGFASDCSDGPDNSIFRTGGTSSGIRTLATWAVIIPPAGSPELDVRILNPGEEERTLRFITDNNFWSVPARSLTL